MQTTEDRLIWLGAGVMSYAVLQIGGLYYGIFFILGLGLMLWGLLRKRRGEQGAPPSAQAGDGDAEATPPRGKGNA